MTLKAVLFDFDDTLIDVSASREARAQRAHQRLTAHGVEVRWNAFWRSINDLDEGGFYSKGMVGAIQDLGLAGTALGDECIGFWAFKGTEDLIALSTGCTDCLDELKERYTLGVITNGAEDFQKHKFAYTGLQSYFDLFLPSGEVGVQKPDPRILHIALERLELRPDEAVFIGDHLDLDIICAQRAGVRSIWYNPKRRPHEFPGIIPDATVRHLGELTVAIEMLA
jgi:putative hydrolase of the HAD superfamily